MKFFALFDGKNIVAGPQSVDPGEWTEVVVDDVLPGVPTEWDFSGSKPRLKKRELSSEEVLLVEGRKVKEKRDRLLQESDWTDTYSAPSRLGQDAYLQWQNYRQALRDVPSQSGYPLAVVWPQTP